MSLEQRRRERRATERAEDPERTARLDEWALRRKQRRRGQHRAGPRRYWLRRTELTGDEWGVRGAYSYRRVDARRLDRVRTAQRRVWRRVARRGKVTAP